MGDNPAVLVQFGVRTRSLELSAEIEPVYAPVERLAPARPGCHLFDLSQPVVVLHGRYATAATFEPGVPDSSTSTEVTRQKPPGVAQAVGALAYIPFEHGRAQHTVIEEAPSNLDQVAPLSFDCRWPTCQHLEDGNFGGSELEFCRKSSRFE